MDAASKFYSTIANLTTLQVFVLGYAAMVCYYFYFRLRSLKRYILNQLLSLRRQKAIQSSPVKFSEFQVQATLLGIRINGRIDEIIELPNDNLLIGDIKSRALAIVYDDDIAEVSLYYYILRAMFPNRVIEDYAYLRCVDPKTGQEEIKIVEFKSWDWFQRLVSNWACVNRGEREANKAATVSVCTGCEFAKRCFNIHDDDDDDDQAISRSDGYSTSAPSWGAGAFDDGL